MPVCRTSEPLALVMLSGKAMADKAPDLLQLFSDVLLTARLDDRERFKQACPALLEPMQRMIQHQLQATHERLHSADDDIDLLPAGEGVHSSHHKRNIY